MTGFCKTKVPKDILSTLESIKDNDEAVKQFGIDLGTQMCRRILDSGVPGLHMYTLNTEVSSVSILENLGLINKAQVGASCYRPQSLSSPVSISVPEPGQQCWPVPAALERCVAPSVDSGCVILTGEGMLCRCERPSHCAAMAVWREPESTSL